MRSRAVIVLGMHRSGTSAVTGALSMLGAELGSDLVAASPFNESGHFEHAGIVRIHERLLASLGLAWSGLAPLPAGWTERAESLALAAELEALVTRELAPSPIWVVKDPRLCRLLALWRPVLAKLAVRPAFVITVRDPREVARSLEERDGLAPWRAGLLYLDHMLIAERETRADPRVFVSYHALLDDPHTEIERILARLGLRELAPDMATLARIRAFLDPALERARPTHRGAPLHPWLEACHVALAAEAADRASEVPLAAALDALAPSVAGACALLGETPLVRAGAAGAPSPVPSAERESDPSEPEAIRGRWAVRVLREELDAREAELARARGILEELGREIESARAAHAERDRRDAARVEELARSARALDAATARASELCATLEERDRECAELEWAVEPLHRAGSSRHLLIETSELLFATPPLTLGRAEGGVREITGWVLTVDGPPISALRVWAGAEISPASLGFERRDVAAMHPHIPGAATSGFVAMTTIPSHTQRLVFEVDRGRGRWERVAVIPIERTGPELRAHVDEPRRLRLAGPRQRVAGWCFCPGDRVVRLALQSGSVRTDTRYGFERPDVAQAFEDVAPDVRCGFDGVIRLPTGIRSVVLLAELASGVVLTHPIPRPFLVLPEWVGDFGRAVARRVEGARELVRFATGLASDYRRRRGGVPPLRRLPALVAHAARLYRERFRVSAGSCLPPGVAPPRREDAYAAWLRVNAWHADAARELELRLERAGDVLPKIAVVMPVYDPPLELLDRAIESVRSQVYESWELCLADDASTNPAVRASLARWAERDRRIRLVCRAENGHISRATNSAAALATGEFLAFLDQDDELAPDALGEVALHLAEHPDTDLVYSDDDKIDLAGRRYAPQFKPDWSPELLLSFMYCTHLLVVRRALFEELGGCRVGFEGSQDHDLALRAAERARRVGHVPLILYHWRAVPGSTATSGDAKPASFEAGRRAVAEALARRGVAAEVARPDWAVAGGLGIYRPTFADDGPSVAIVIPSKDQLPLLRACIRSLAKTRYANYRIVVIDNESREPDTLEFLAHGAFDVVRIPSPGGRFSFSALVNAAARSVEAEYLVLLNNDTEVRSPDWLSQMMGYARLPGVGAVGAHLLFPDGRTQHAGIVRGFHHGLAGHAFKLTRADDHGYLSLKAVARDCAAVTGACLLTPRALFLELGGFDEERFAVAYNDVEYGHRLSTRGLRTVYVPCELVHHEGVSRGFADNPREVAAYRRVLSREPDPFLSPHLSRAGERFDIQPRRLIRDRSRRLRLLCVSHNLNHEGAPQHQYDLAVALGRDHGIDPVVLSPLEGPLRALYERAGIEVNVEAHPLAGAGDAASHARAIAQFAERLRAFAADVVYANTIHAYHAVAAATSAGIPVVWNIHESEGCAALFRHHPRHVLDEVIRCFALPYRVIFTSDAACDVYRCLDSRHNFTVVHDALDPERLAERAERWPRDEARASLGIAADDRVLLLLGTVCERKGQLDLPLALAQLPASWWERVRCFIVGDRGLPYSRAVSNAIAALPAGLRERVALHPETPDPVRYFRAADLFVCTSRIESFPHVLLEAMTFGLPIVTTPVFGIREQVRENVNALFYEPGEAANLARSLVRVLSDDELCARFASASPFVGAGLTSFPEMIEAYGEALREAAATVAR